MAKRKKGQSVQVRKKFYHGTCGVRPETQKKRLTAIILHHSLILSDGCSQVGPMAKTFDIETITGFSEREVQEVLAKEGYNEILSATISLKLGFKTVFESPHLWGHKKFLMGLWG